MSVKEFNDFLRETLRLIRQMEERDEIIYNNELLKNNKQKKNVEY